MEEGNHETSHPRVVDVWCQTYDDDDDDDNDDDNDDDDVDDDDDETKNLQII